VKVGKKVRKVHILPKPIKVNWAPKSIPVEIPTIKKDEVKKNAND